MIDIHLTLFQDDPAMSPPRVGAVPQKKKKKDKKKKKIKSKNRPEKVKIIM